MAGTWWCCRYGWYQLLAATCWNYLNFDIGIDFIGTANKFMAIFKFWRLRKWQEQKTKTKLKCLLELQLSVQFMCHRIRFVLHTTNISLKHTRVSFFSFHFIFGASKYINRSLYKLLDDCFEFSTSSSADFQFLMNPKFRHSLWFFSAVTSSQPMEQKKVPATTTITEKERARECDILKEIRWMMVKERSHRSRSEESVEKRHENNIIMHE